MKFTRFIYVLMLLFCSCTTTTVPLPSSENQGVDSARDQKKSVQSNTDEGQIKLGVIAVAKVSLDHPMAKRVFSTQIIQDSISAELMQSGRIDVIDWARFSEVLFRRNLEWSDLVENVDGRKQIKEVLFNDYFLSGSIFSYSERIDYASSAFSKSKSQVIEVKADFFIKDALSNEILISVRGSGNATRKITQTLGFGAAGSSDSALAHEALNNAIAQSVEHLLAGLENLKASE